MRSSHWSQYAKTLRTERKYTVRATDGRCERSGKTAPTSAFVRYRRYCPTETRKTIKASGGIDAVAIRVLIADDHDAIRKGVATILSHDGIEVCGEASNGIEAVTNAVQLRPDIVILDLTMPLMDGFEAARKLHKVLPDIPILIYSMHGSDQLIKEIRRLGLQGFVSKSDIS